MGTRRAVTRNGAATSAAEGRSQAATIKVGVFEENEMFALGVRACLAVDSLIEMASRSDEAIEVAVVSPRAAGEKRFTCPLVICGDAPNSVAAGNVVLAVLPRRTLTPERLIASVHAAAAGLRVAPSELPQVSRLDGRALDVLELLAIGAGTREIAERLAYSERTIKSVIQQLQLTLSARNRAQVVAEAVRQGLI